MSSTIQNKLVNLEVMPPATAWNNIAAGLDESHIAAGFVTKLAKIEVVPPSFVWDSIENELNNSPVAFSTKLYDMETTPPAAVWSRINSSLDEKDETVVPQRRRIAAFVKYAAAAMLVGIVAFGAYKFFDKPATTVDNVLAQQEQPDVQNNQNPGDNIGADDPANQTLPIANSLAQDLQDEAALEQSKNTYASLDVAEKRRVISRLNQDFIGQPASPINASSNISPENTYKDVECSDVHTPSFANINPAFENANRYALLMSPDGHMIRVSKKLGDMVCCVSGEEQDEDCKDQLDKWRKKIANSPVAPSPENFMDILDLLHALKDKSL